MKKLLIIFTAVLFFLTSCAVNSEPFPPEIVQDSVIQTTLPTADTTENEIDTDAVETELPEILPETVSESETDEIMSESTEVIETGETEENFSESFEGIETEEAAESVPETQAVTESITNVVTEYVEKTDPSLEYIYLTFDDGPGKYTETVLEILDKYDVKATFFVVGQFAEYYPSRLRAIADAGHTIGCHSTTHEYRKIYASSEAITGDIATWEKIISGTLGYVPDERLYRFPGGSTCTAIEKDSFDGLYEAVTTLGYRAFDWTCANNDMWYGQMKQEQSKVDYLKESVINSLGWCGEPRILLLHETVAETVEMLDWMIGYLLDEGYTFATLDTYDGNYLFAR